MSDTNPQWKSKMQDIFQLCQDELKRTTEIGKRMLSASKANSMIHETYQTIGEYTVKMLRSGDLKWDDEKIKEYLAKIDECEKEIEEMEGEVNNLRFSEDKKSQESSEK